MEEETTLTANATIDSVIQDPVAPVEMATAKAVEQANLIDVVLEFLQRDFAFGSLSFTPLSIIGGLILLVCHVARTIRFRDDPARRAVYESNVELISDSRRFSAWLDSMASD